MANSSNGSQSSDTWHSIRLRFRHVSIVLGLLLVAAAALKARGMVLDSLSQTSIFSSQQFEILGSVVEASLGLLLLSGYWQRWAWTLALGLFSFLGAISLYLILAGQKSCDCFGPLKTSPFVALSVDAVAILLLLIGRPMMASSDAPTPQSRGMRGGPAFLLTIISLMAIIGVTLSFDPGSILAQIQGHLIAVEPSLSETGEADEGELRVAAVHLTNHSKQKICIVGSSADCSCVTTEKLPKTILPGESLLLHVNTVYRGDPGVFLRRLVLLTDCPEQPAITVRVTGKVISSLHSVRPGSGNDHRTLLCNSK